MGGAVFPPCSLASFKRTYSSQLFAVWMDGQTQRWMEQNTEPRNRSTQICPIDFFKLNNFYFAKIYITTWEFKIQEQLIHHSVLLIITIVYFQNFFITQNRNCILLSFSLPSYPNSHPGNLLSVSMNLPLLGISHAWNHTLGGLLHLAYFT